MLRVLDWKLHPTLATNVLDQLESFFLLPDYVVVSARLVLVAIRPALAPKEWPPATQAAAAMLLVARRMRMNIDPERLAGACGTDLQQLDLAVAALASSCTRVL